MGGGAAVNKELRREVREIYRTCRWPARPCLRPMGGPAQKCASAPRALPGTPDGQSSPGCDCRGVGGVLSNWWCSLVGRRCSETSGSVHPMTEQECLAFGLYIVAVRLSCNYGNTCLVFGLYIVAVRLSCTSEARVTQWRILVQVAELVWAEIPGARAGIFKSPALLRNKAGEIQTARLQTHFLTLQITDVVVKTYA